MYENDEEIDDFNVDLANVPSSSQEQLMEILGENENKPTDNEFEEMIYTDL